MAYIRDKSYEINIANGSQTVDWLADVVLFKYKRTQFEKLNCRGVKHQNKMLDMDQTIASQVENGKDVYILLEGDEDVDEMFGNEV
jgi:disulfide oxidoreductase YuzD